MIITVDETSSTNTLLKEMNASHGTAVMAIRQTAGRGQRGNTWESEPGKNVTLSIILRPKSLPAADQFVISMIVAVATARLVSDYLKIAQVDKKVTVKWPNDIYVGEKKISGILIENAISSGAVASSIIGIGLNVNQVKFLSDAPNPISLANITGCEYDVSEVAERLVEKILNLYDETVLAGKIPELEQTYRSLLYRRTGIYQWREAETGRVFKAEIYGIDPFGRLMLKEDLKATPTAYAFKEVVYL